MLRLAWLAALGVAVAPQPICMQQESEPNGSFVAADLARTTLPVWPPVALCGESGRSDLDLWRIPLDYHTSWLCEGEANFALDAEGPCKLILVSPEPIRSGYAILGTWQSASGHIKTGQVGVMYYHRSLDHVFAIVEVAGRRAPYRLTYW